MKLKFSSLIYLSTSYSSETFKARMAYGLSAEKLKKNRNYEKFSNYYYSMNFFFLSGYLEKEQMSHGTTYGVLTTLGHTTPGYPTCSALLQMVVSGDRKIMSI